MLQQPRKGLGLRQAGGSGASAARNRGCEGWWVCRAVRTPGRIHGTETWKPRPPRVPSQHDSWWESVVHGSLG